jgi:hypothetical protein
MDYPGMELYYFAPREGAWQPGKKVLETIFEVCPLVTSAKGLKYGLFWPSHGSPGPPHSYPPITPNAVRRSM